MSKYGNYVVGADEDGTIVFNEQENCYEENTVKDAVEILLDIYLDATQYNQKAKPSQETVDRHYQIQADFVDGLVELFKEKNNG